MHGRLPAIRQCLARVDELDERLLAQQELLRRCTPEAERDELPTRRLQMACFSMCSHKLVSSRARTMTRNLCRMRMVLGGLALLASVGAAIAAPRDEISAPKSSPANLDLKGVGYSADLKGKIVVYKVKLAGGNAWVTGAPNSWAIFDVVDGRSVIVKQSTLIVNGWTGYSKWWDHNVIATRACKQTQTGWDDPSSCVIGNGNVVKLPEGESIFDYFFEFKWEENGGVQVGKTAIDPKAKPTDVRSMN